VTQGLSADVFAKLEYTNPGGSSKDRIAKYMIEAAERDGRLRPGMLILENSSGNTAMGLAMVGIQKGYRVRVVVRDSLTREKRDQLLAMGVELHEVDSRLPPSHPDSYNNITPRLAQALGACYFPDQHGNRENNLAHYHTTGPEIWEQMDGRIDAFVAGAGTGGTIGGAGRYLKEQDPRIQVIAVDPAGSIFYDRFHGRTDTPRPYLVEGLGDEFPIPTMDFGVLDGILRVTDEQIFRHARWLARTEGILAGGSSGAALWGALETARRAGRPARIVTVFPDAGTRYLSTIYNDDWMRAQGFDPGVEFNPAGSLPIEWECQTPR
jgi:cystathionine beta-synthase